MSEQKWSKVIDGIQTAMLAILIIVITVCILSLIFFDALAGAGIMLYLTNGNVLVSILISLATSGLLLSLMFIGYELITNKKSKSVVGWGLVVLLVAGLVYCVDVYFDSLTADYLRFGNIVLIESLPEGDIQWLFRSLIGGISTVGESLAISIILGMPVLKKIISNALPNTGKTNNSTSGFNRPIPRPINSGLKNSDVFSRLPRG